MAAEVLLALVRANIAAGVAILLVLTLRAPMRRLFGAERAYRLWLMAPAAITGALFNVSKGVAASSGEGLGVSARLWLARGDHHAVVLIVWLLGVAASLILAAWSQGRFLAAAKAGRAGPAAVGVFHARLVLPSDFTARFNPDERRLVIAHERAHIERLDSRANALAVLLQSLGWFNPLLHLAAGAMRLDQELACDATVTARLPRERRAYAEALLKTQQTASGPLLGCRWGERGAHPLEIRIAMLGRQPPTRVRQRLGLATVVLLGLTVLAVAHAVQPPQPPWPAMVMTMPMAVLLDLDSGPRHALTR
jgi:beta-lactamase regulating signal transducer with metallopeptidase domain